MAQSLEGRLARLKWLGDMEPEYEETLEWMNLLGEMQGVPSEDRFPIHWGVVAQNMSRVVGGTGSSNGLRAASVH